MESFIHCCEHELLWAPSKRQLYVGTLNHRFQNTIHMYSTWNLLSLTYDFMFQRSHEIHTKMVLNEKIMILQYFSMVQNCSKRNVLTLRNLTLQGITLLTITSTIKLWKGWAVHLRECK